MILPLFRRASRSGDTISALYGAIVAQARSPAFYRDYAVPDTLDGRFVLILLHMALVLRRLGNEPELQPVGQEIFDLFCTDMDRNLREIGISDLKVPKEMRRMGEAFYGRAQAYEAALASDDTGLLRTAIARNVFGTDDADHGGATRLAAYILDASGRLAGQDVAAFNRGVVDFPEPA